ncbi:MAG: hypothetical protein CL760_06300 [Chloroflexi bacterium]|nr:hypothetical protein [Chloroflexota bacterium]|tara:strand:- start:51565 stop:52017 length:453 start_codon:yes stop_codon:yes gene_type:complete
MGWSNDVTVMKSENIEIDLNALREKFTEDDYPYKIDGNLLIDVDYDKTLLFFFQEDRDYSKFSRIYKGELDLNFLTEVSKYMTSGMAIIKQQFEDRDQVPNFFVLEPNRAYSIDIEMVVLALAEIGPEALNLKISNSGSMQHESNLLENK